ncbi:hypothetical protein [Stakelama tenebrarum]|uniref:Uncharacterized protein n=1 Tax=Stakelama tenebrarum TaxID=2711215 RepID=A0A6G6Y5P1_9SPHN|nr:hypothetical protein [Sphingosinithalassobacter tenebrarum]QIG80117.1 hypothetical protein G5C33_10215 [Sphingosinithalassobacter tenebrarum]
MAAFNPVDLTAIKCREATGTLQDFGSLQEPEHGGPSFKIDRLGGGFAIALTIPYEHIEPDGRRWIARLQTARRLGARVEYPQLDLNVGAPGNPTVDGSAAGGTTLPVTGATPRYAVREGQALNVVKGGRSYLYFAAAQTILDGSGEGDILLTTPLRTQLAGGEGINLGKPILEGWLQGDNFSWTLELIRMVGLNFTLKERA